MTSRGNNHPGADENLVDFMARFTASEQFNRVFQEGMGLVEETADYLDGPGRAEARALARPAALAYATESMRLTTRLMQMASWLLLQRAISSGEISPEAAREEKSRISLKEDASPARGHSTEGLPEGLLKLSARSLRLRERIVKLDAMICEREKLEAKNPVAGHMDKLMEAFGQAR